MLNLVRLGMQIDSFLGYKLTHLEPVTIRVIIAIHGFTSLWRLRDLSLSPNLTQPDHFLSDFLFFKKTHKMLISMS